MPPNRLGKSTDLIHPAPYSPPIMDRISAICYRRNVKCALDPFAGTGRIHQIADDVGFVSIGIELEPEWANMHPRTQVGDACYLPFGDRAFDAIITSPTYGNRMADTHEQYDDSVKYTYHHVLGRKPSANNSGVMQWGHGYRVLHERAWTEAYRVLKPGGAVILNIKDHIRGGALIHVSAWHIATLQALGLRLVEIETVPASMLPRRDTSRLGVAHEYLFTLSKPVRFSAATMA